MCGRSFAAMHITLAGTIEVFTAAHVEAAAEDLGRLFKMNPADINAQVEAGSVVLQVILAKAGISGCKFVSDFKDKVKRGIVNDIAGFPIGKVTSLCNDPTSEKEHRQQCAIAFKSCLALHKGKFGLVETGVSCANGEAETENEDSGASSQRRMLGRQETAESCAAECAEQPGCHYFALGTGADWSGVCYWEVDAACEGKKLIPGPYDSYRMTGEASCLVELKRCENSRPLTGAPSFSPSEPPTLVPTMSPTQEPSDIPSMHPSKSSDSNAWAADVAGAKIASFAERG